MKKTIIALLIMTLLSVLFAGCGKNPDVSKETTGNDITDAAGTTAVDTADLYDKNGYLKDSIPDGINLDKTVRILCWSDAQVNEFDVDKSESANATLNDAVYSRNLDVSQRLGIELEYTAIPGNAKNTAAYVSAVETNETSGSAEYDIIASYSRTTATCALRGLTLNLLDSDTLDFTKPWWPDSLIEQSTINDRLYFASGDISANVLYNMSAVFFNKQMIKDYNLDDPFTLVNNNGWTLEKFAGMCKNIYRDTNEAATGKDKGDTFAYIATNIQTQSFYWGCGQKMIKSTSSGIAADDSFDSEKTEKILEALCGILHGSNDGIVDSSGVKAFSEKRVLFISNVVYYSTTTLKDAAGLEYGIIPLPKYDDSQDKYYSILGNTITLYAIPKSAVSFGDSSTVLECLASESYRTVSPAVFEVAMKAKYSPDEITSSMFDLLRGGMLFDLGRIYSTNIDDAFTATWNNCITDNNTNLIASFASRKSQLDTRIGEINDVFKK